MVNTMVLLPTHPTLTFLTKQELITLVSVNRKRAGVPVMQDIRLVDANTLHELAVNLLTMLQTMPTAEALHIIVPDLSPELLQGGLRWFEVIAAVLKADPAAMRDCVQDAISKRLIMPVLAAFKQEAHSTHIVEALFSVYGELPRAEALREHGAALDSRVSQVITEQYAAYQRLPRLAQGALTLPLLLGGDLIRDSEC